MEARLQKKQEEEKKAATAATPPCTCMCAGNAARFFGEADTGSEGRLEEAGFPEASKSTEIVGGPSQKLDPSKVGDPSQELGPHELSR